MFMKRVFPELKFKAWEKDIIYRSYKVPAAAAAESWSWWFVGSQSEQAASQDKLHVNYNCVFFYRPTKIGDAYALLQLWKLYFNRKAWDQRPSISAGLSEITFFILMFCAALISRRAAPEWSAILSLPSEFLLISLSERRFYILEITLDCFWKHGNRLTQQARDKYHHVIT